MKEMSMKERVHYLSFASVVSILAVIMIHVNSLFFWDFGGTENWWSANLIETFMRFAVPVFFMSSGANLIDYSERYSTKVFFRKRFIKTGIPFLAWCCVFGIIYTILTGKVEFSFSLEGFNSAVSDYMSTNVYLMYWFLIIISGIYLCMPLLTHIKAEYKELIITYLIVVLFIVKYFFPFICKIFQISYISSSLISDRIITYLIFVLLGYVLHKKNIPFYWRVVSYVLALLGFVLQSYGTYRLSEEAGSTVELFVGYNNMPCLLWAVGVFIFIKQMFMRINSEWLHKVIECLSGYTYSIYLIHFFFVDYFEPIIRNAQTVVYKILITVIIFFLCVCVIWIIRRIPILRKIVP